MKNSKNGNYEKNIFHYMVGIYFSHWNTLKKWTLTYQIQKVGHSDLIQLWVRASHPRCLWTTLTISICATKVYRQTDGWTDGRMDRRKVGWMPDTMWSHTHSLSKLKSWAKNNITILFTCLAKVGLLVET